MAHPLGASGVDVTAPALAGPVRLEVERLDHVADREGVHVLRAAGRAWAGRELRLEAPVLVAGTTRVACTPGTRPVRAGPGGPGWTAEFDVPHAIGAAARSWAVEAGLEPTLRERADLPSGERARAVVTLESALAELRGLDARARQLAVRTAELAAHAGRLRGAADEVRDLRAALEVARADRDRLAAVSDPAPPESAAEVVADPARRRRRRAGTVTIVALAGAGALLVGDALATVFWQEPLSGLLAARRQSALADDLARLDARLGSSMSRPSARRPDRDRIEQLAGRLRASTAPGDAVGRLTVPRIGGSWVVVQGTGTDALRRGPGHYPTTSLPGRPGTTALAGHRTTYGAPFRRIDELEAGDRLIMAMPYGTFTYRVEGRRIVAPSHVGVLRDIGRPRLVLTACHPRYSARQRIVVSARQVEAVPRGAARRVTS